MWKKCSICHWIILFLLIVFIGSYHHTTFAFSDQVIQRGATGSDVTELQTRLKKIGYYKGEIDGVYGWSTYWAVRNFQDRFGLPVDGLVGSNTKQKLLRASGEVTLPKGIKKASNTPSGFSNNEIRLIANAVHGEARGEPYVGQVAVAAVILNRLENAAFPDTVSGVIFEPRAFTAVADGQIWLEPNEKSRKAVIDAMNGWDPTGGAIYYFNPDTATSPWIWTRPQIKTIGNHIFCH